MSPRREFALFAAALAAAVGAFLGEAFLPGRALSPADVLLADPAFRDWLGPAPAVPYRPANKLLMDPVLQFEPWLAFARGELRAGRLPTWNPHAGCGAPFLANGQSAVFDPFHLIAYLGTLPSAHAWMAAARLWVAGIGMFLLARAWGLRAAGRWFCGLCWPSCGFLVGWLLYPPAAVAIWLPWAFWASERLAQRPDWRGAGRLGIACGLAFLGGHIQTTAHVLIAVAAYLLWRRTPPRLAIAGLALGVAIGAVSWLPLAFALRQSAEWSNRQSEAVPAWKVAPLRIPEAGCTAFPYLFGSQRRGHPNLAGPLGVDNVNESASGFAGLAALIWLAPLGWLARRRHPQARFLAGLAAAGALGAFQVPPVANLLRAIPVLDVIDHRRLVLWIAFATVGLAGIGFDRLSLARRSRFPGPLLRWWVLAGLGLMTVGLAIPIFRETISGLVLGVAKGDRDRAAPQIEGILWFLSPYYFLCGLHLLALSAIARGLRRGGLGRRGAQALIAGLAAIDLLGFGRGLNPATDRALSETEPPLIKHLRGILRPGERAIGCLDAMLPNTLMRWGLADARNYDSIEVASNLERLGPIFEPDGRGPNSRRDVTLKRAREHTGLLGESSIGAVVYREDDPNRPLSWGPRGPAPATTQEEISILQIPCKPPIEVVGGVLASSEEIPGRLALEVDSAAGCRLIVRQTFAPGWRAEIDGEPAAIAPTANSFLSAEVPPGRRTVRLSYEPPEVAAALATSAGGLAIGLMLLIAGAARRREGGGDPGTGRSRAGTN